jgi:hypothetical protein
MTIPDLRTIPIRRVTTLKPVAVYKLSSIVGDYVVKAEQGGRANTVDELTTSVGFMLKIFKAITPGFPDVRLLTAPELAFFLGRVEKTREDFGAKAMFYLMDNVINLADFGDVAKSAATLTEPQRSRLDKLCTLVRSKPAMAKDLGRIFVCDMFNSSNDRLYFAQSTTESSVYDLQSNAAAGFEPVGIGNYGNFFVTSNVAMTEGKFLGIDFWDPSNPLPNLCRTIPVLKDIESCDWAGDLLREGQTRQRDRIPGLFAEVFNARAKRNHALTPVFTAKHVKEIRAGMSTAREALKVFLKAQVKSREPIPAGIPDRMRRLRWALRPQYSTKRKEQRFVFGRD